MQNIISHKKILITVFFMSLVLRASAAFFYLNFDRHALTLDRRPFIGGAYTSWQVMGDRDRYNTIADSIVNTGKIGDSKDSIVHPPLYSFYLAIFYRLFGFNIYSFLLPQIILDSVNSLLVFILAFHLFGSNRIAQLAGLFYAFNPHFILLSIQLYSETLYFFLILCVFLYLDKLYSKPAAINIILSGLLMSLAALCRSIFLVFIPFIFIWLAAVYFKDKKRLLVSCLGVFLSFSLLTGLWLIRNYKVFNQIIFSRDYQLVVAKDVSKPAYQFDRYVEKHEDEGAAFFDWVKDNPGKYYKLCLSRLRIFLFKPYPEQVTLRHRIVSAAIFYLVFPLGYFGLAVSLLKRNKLALLMAFFILSVSVTHILTGQEAELRYRLPIEILLGIFASFAAVNIVNKFRQKGIDEPIKRLLRAA